MDASLGSFQRIDAGYEFENEDFQNRLLPPAPTTSFFTDVAQRSNAVFVQDQLRFFKGHLQIAGAYRAQFFTLDQPLFQPVSGAPLPEKRSPLRQPLRQAMLRQLTRSAGPAQRFALMRVEATALPHCTNASESSTEVRATRFTATRACVPIAPARSTEESTRGSGTRVCSSRQAISYTRLNETIIFDSSGAINAVTDPLGRSGGYRNTAEGSRAEPNSAHPWPRRVRCS